MPMKPADKFILFCLFLFLTDLRIALYVSGGVILGMLINPYFPHNLIFSYHHMLPKLANATSVSVGNEWYPVRIPNNFWITRSRRSWRLQAAFLLWD